MAHCLEAGHKMVIRHWNASWRSLWTMRQNQSFCSTAMITLLLCTRNSPSLVVLYCHRLILCLKVLSKLLNCCFQWAIWSIGVNNKAFHSFVFTALQLWKGKVLGVLRILNWTLASWILYSIIIIQWMMLSLDHMLLMVYVYNTGQDWMLHFSRSLEKLKASYMGRLLANIRSW